MGVGMVDRRLLWIAALVAGSHQAAAAAMPVDFAKDVAPLLVERCLSCHNAGKAKGGLDLSAAKPALAGGDAGPSVVPGHPAESPLIGAITAAGPGERPEMPKAGDPLTAEQVALLGRWVAEGASWPDGLVLKEKARWPIFLNG